MFLVPSITCRVCENQIPYQNKTMQHVVRCPICKEATPIRSAPTGKKFVRCPCNCLLICKVSSNRIACPRPDCNRVIILKPASSSEAAVPAPAGNLYKIFYINVVGTARICCFYCEEVFMYNTIANQIVRCPHCQKKSSIGISFTRSRTILYFVASLSFFLVELFLMVSLENSF
jgi:phosphatidylinositol-4,5-bisphosphate 4-phosphatase